MCNNKDCKYSLDVEDLFAIHEQESFRDTYLIFVNHYDGKTNDTQRMILNKKELYKLYDKIGRVL